MEGYKFYKGFSFILLTLLFPANKIFANKTDKREYEKSCAHWVEDGQKIEFLLQTGQPVKILDDNYVKKEKSINLVSNEIERRKKYFLRLDNNLRCVFTEYSLDEIKDLRFDLIMYDLCKFLGFGNVPPIVWRDNLVIDGKRHRGTLQLFFEKLDIKGYDEENLRRSMSGVSQRELDEHRIFNLLFGTWESSLEELSICGGYLVHNDSANMKLKQEIEKYGDVPFILLHECDDKQVSKYINEYEDQVKKSDEIYEQEKLKAKKERQKVREQLQKQKSEEEKKLQQMKDAFKKQKEAYLKQQQEILRQQEEMMRKQQEEMMRQQQMFQGQQNQNFYPQQNFPQNQYQQQMYDPFQNVPEPVNPQIDYLEQQIRFLDDQDELADAEIIEPFPFYSSLPLNEEERNRIACYYAYNPPKFEHNYIIWKHNYWLQFSDVKTQHDIKYVLFPKFLTSTMKEKLQHFTRVRALEFFLKNRYYRMHEEQIQEYISKCLPYVDDIMRRRDMILEEFERREAEESKTKS